MNSQNQPLDAIRDIHRMMERSSRFISLSGWSGVAAGCCALAGAWLAGSRIAVFRASENPENYRKSGHLMIDLGANALLRELLVIAAVTFLLALLTAFFFTWLRSRKKNIPLWDHTAQRLLWNTLLPMAVGGLAILRIMQLGYFELVSPVCLLFYGLALVNGSKYTLGEIRWLGYVQLLLGLINLWVQQGSLYFWAAGFGVMHIVYGTWMWWKYER